MGTQEFQNKLMSLQGNLLNFAYMLTSNRDNAYDLLQDTTLKALDNESKYVDNTNFKGWVFTIMRNIFINNYRRVVPLPLLTRLKISITLISRRIQDLKHRKDLSEQTRFQMQSTNFPTNTVFLSPCTSPGTSTMKSPKR